MIFTGYDTIFDYLSKVRIEDGIHQMKLANNEVIDFEIYNYYSDIVFEQSPVLGDNILDTKTLILYFHRNLTVNSGVLLTPQVRKKGIIIYCKGEFINNGTISMTARGASAVGQNILLYKNRDDTFEIIPAAGAKGGESVETPSSQTYVRGKNGKNGTGRQTGGGASGSAGFTTYTPSVWYTLSGRGGIGTSYSGGAGGAGVRHACTAEHGSDTGGAGGSCHGDYGGFSGSGGTGNPGGKTDSKNQGNVEYGVDGTNGTGGLIIIYSYSFKNKGIIESKGSGSNAPLWASGGGSGGGSINIFYQNLILEGNISAAGYSQNGLKGGNGTVTLTEIEMETGYYLVKNKGVYKYYLNNQWNTIENEPTKDDYINYGMPISIVSKHEIWQKLSGETEILYADKTGMKEYINYNAIPLDQIIISKNSIKLPFTKILKSILAGDNIENNGIIKRLISADEGNTWFYYNEGWKKFDFIHTPPKEDYSDSQQWLDWISENHKEDIENIKLYGLTLEQLSDNGITDKQISEIFQKEEMDRTIKFLTVISVENYYDKAETEKISIIQDKFNEYKQDSNFEQIQKINKIILIPNFDSKEIKINYLI